MSDTNSDQAKPGRGNYPVHIGFSLVFTPYLSNAVVLQQNRHVIFHALVALKPEAVGIAHKPPRSL